MDGDQPSANSLWPSAFILQPLSYSFSLQPLAYSFSLQPLANSLSLQPQPTAFSLQPLAYSLSLQPLAYSLSLQPLAYSLSPKPLSYSLSLQPPAFSLQPSALSLQPSALSLQPLAYSLQSLALHPGHADLAVLRPHARLHGHGVRAGAPHRRVQHRHPAGRAQTLLSYPHPVSLPSSSRATSTKQTSIMTGFQTTDSRLGLFYIYCSKSTESI